MNFLITLAETVATTDLNNGRIRFRLGSDQTGIASLRL